jgi:chromate transport protein ChrA
MTERLRELALGFFKLGARAYDGPAIMGVMHAESDERRQWISRQRLTPARRTTR